MTNNNAAKLAVKDKVFYGLLSPILLMIAMAAMIFLIFPFEALGKALLINNLYNPGYLAYFTLSLSLAALAFHFAIKTGEKPELSIYIGFLGGLLTWTAAEMGTLAGGIEIEDFSGIYTFLVAFIPLLFIMYKKYLPLGPLAYILMFFFNWGSHLLLKVPRHLLEGTSALPIVEKVWLVLSILTIVGSIYAVFTKVKSKATALYFGSAIWVSLAIIAYVIKG